MLGLTEEDEETGEGLRIGLQLTGKVLSDTVEIDLHKLKDEIVEIRHIPTGDPDDEENLVVIEAYDDDDIVKVEYVDIPILGGDFNHSLIISKPY